LAAAVLAVCAADGIALGEAHCGLPHVPADRAAGGRTLGGALSAATAPSHGPAVDAARVAAFVPTIHSTERGPVRAAALTSDSSAVPSAGRPTLLATRGISLGTTHWPTHPLAYSATSISAHEQAHVSLADLEALVRAQRTARLAAHEAAEGISFRRAFVAAGVPSEPRTLRPARRRPQQAAVTLADKCSQQAAFFTTHETAFEATCALSQSPTQPPTLRKA
jgi:hypothetical protein